MSRESHGKVELATMFGNGAGGMEEGQADGVVNGAAAKGEAGSAEEDQAVRLVVPAANCKEPTKMWWFYVRGTKSSIKRYILY
jgi:hypothetical protein